MKFAVGIACVFIVVSVEANAGTRVISGSNGPVTVGNPYSGVVNKGVINGGSATGLTVTGSAAASVINKGSIGGATGVKITSSSSSTFVNTGRISASSTGSSSAKATGVSQ